MKKENHEYLYEIINFWLSNEKYEYYLNSLFQNMPKVFNLNDKPVLEIVLEKYLTSLLDELVNQKSEIVDKNYYLRLFNKLYFSPFYDHKLDESLEKIISSFKTSIKLRNFKSERKIASLENINQLGKLEDSPCKMYEISLEEVKETERYLPIYMHSSLREERRDLTNDNAIIIKDSDNDFSSYALSINYTLNKEINLNFHILDVPSLIEENTPLYKDLANNNTLSKEVISKLSLKKGSVSPCFTISLTIDNKGKIYDYEMFKSIIEVKNIYAKQTLYNDIRKNDETKLYTKAYRLLNHFYHINCEAATFKDIEETFRHTLSIMIGSRVRMELPFIYKVQDAPNEKELYHQLSNLNYYLHHLKDEDYRKIYEIICNKNNTKAYYSTSNIKHFSTKKKYKMDILKPFTFTGYNILSLLKDYHINNLSVSLITAKYEDLFEDIVSYYNKKFYNIEKEKGYSRKRK